MVQLIGKLLVVVVVVVVVAVVVVLVVEEKLVEEMHLSFERIFSTPFYFLIFFLSLSLPLTFTPLTS